MAKFSDIPHFLIKKYYEVLLGYRTNPKFNVSSSGSLFPPVQFVNRPEIEFKDRTDVIWNKKFNVDTFTSDSYVIGDRKTIVTKGDFVLELFAKDPTYGYRPIWITVNDFGDNNIRVVKNNQINVPVSTYSEYITDSSDIKIYDLGLNELTHLIEGEEVYFRKDSTFYDWIKNYAKSYVEDEYGIEFILRNYVNTDKNFIYFGQIYKLYNSENEYNINYYGMKDYVRDMVPDHQQTDRVKELIRLNFDVLSNEIYNLEKNVYSLNDAFEIDPKYLNKLSSICGFEIDDLYINDTLKRNFVNELINVTKMKGTYSSLYSIWKLVTGNTKNLLNFYDWWHDKNINGLVSEYAVFPSLGYYDYQRSAESLYMEAWFAKYYPEDYPQNQDQQCLSTKYTVEFDLSREPLLDEKIIDENFANKLIEYWEGYRPINRITDYKMFISPIVKLSTKDTSLYDLDLNAYFYSRCLAKDFTLANAYLKIFNGKGPYQGYHIEHNLGNKYVNVQLFNNELKHIFPDEIEFIDENSFDVKLEIDDLFLVLVKKPIYTITKEPPEVPLNSRYIQSLFSIDDSEIIPETFRVLDSSRAVVEPSDVDRNYSVFTFIHKQEISSNIWTVNHGLDSSGILVNVYDNSNNKIYPKEIRYINENILEIHFDEPILGYGVLTDNGNVLIYNSGGPVNSFIVDHNLNSKFLNIQTFSSDLVEIIPDELNFLNDNQIEVKLGEGVVEHFFVLVNLSDSSNNYIHNLKDQYFLTQIMDDGGNVVVPNNLILFDGSRIKCDYNQGTAALLKKNYMFFQNSLETTWTIEHNLNTRALLINVYDISNRKMYPKTLKFVDENTILLDFDTPLNGYILITEDQPFNTYYSAVPVKEWTINHSLDNSLVNVQIYNLDFEEIIPSNVQLLDSNSLKISFEEFVECFVIIMPSTNGIGNKEKWLIAHNLNQMHVYTQFQNFEDNVVNPNVVELMSMQTVRTDLDYGIGTFSKYDSIHFQNAQTTEWIVTHNLQTSGVLVNVYDINNLKVYPTDIILINENTIKLTFEEAFIGYCVVVSVGSPAFIEAILSSKMNFYYDNNLQYSTNVKDIWDDEEFLYISATIPKTETFLINSIAILNDLEKTLFISECSEIFKSNKVEMNLLYRIVKRNN